MPTDSYTAAIGNRLWGGGAWLVWRKPDAQPAVTSDVGQEAPWDMLLAYVQHQLQTTSGDEFLVSAGSRSLTDMEMTVLTYMARFIGQIEAARAFTATADSRAWYGSVKQTIRKMAPDTFGSDVQKMTQSLIAKTLNAAGLVMETGLPYFTINEAARGLVEKLNIRPDPNVRTRVAAGVSSLAATVSSTAADVRSRVKNWRK